MITVNPTSTSNIDSNSIGDCVFALEKIIGSKTFEYYATHEVRSFYSLLENANINTVNAQVDVHLTSIQQCLENNQKNLTSLYIFFFIVFYALDKSPVNIGDLARTSSNDTLLYEKFVTIPTNNNKTTDCI